MSVAVLIIVGFVLLLGFTVFFGAPYVPSRKKQIAVAFRDLYPLSKKDMVLDLGSGDGIVLRVAAGYGARAVGYELNPVLVFISALLSRHDPRVQVRCVNMWKVAFPSETTIVYVFGDSRDIKKITGKIEREAVRLKRTLYVMSYGFLLPGHEPVKQHGAYHLYKIVPLHRRKPQV